MAHTNRIRAAKAVDIVEAAYRLDGSEATWLDAIVEQASADLDTGNGVYAFTGDESVPNFAKSPTFVERSLTQAFRARLAELNASAPNAIFDLLSNRLVTCGGLEQVLGADSPVVAHFRGFMASAGVADGFCMFAQDAEGGSMTIASPARPPVAPSPRVRGIWQRVGLHLVAGLRLRRKLAARATQRAALLSPSGALEDASAAVANDGAARRALAEAVRAMDQARRSIVRDSPERALELWRGLVAGEWSLVDHWEQGSRRYIAAYPNRPGMRDPRAFSRTEQGILRYLALGATTKEASYALGLSEKTVTGCVTQILRKLRVRSRVELASVLAASRSTLFDVPLGDERIGVLAIDVVPSGSGAIAPLTTAEREVAEHVARGWSNARIAAARGVSVSTVAKQVQMIFSRLGVENRSQLARAVARGSVNASQ
jgi:DNA-binding NarL/FixJ family response regulator